MTIDAETFARASLRDLGRLLRAGETSPVELAELALERLDTAGRQLNAVVTLTHERALREALAAEEELRAGRDRGPLHGIPYGAKDLLATAGIPTTWGAAPFRDQVFEYDATVVTRLHAAGAVLVAKLAMVELAGGMGYDQPNASFTGPGRSPWNREAWSGGSSSGSGAAVGARAVPFAIGSETSGSILTPSSFCGVTGLRPTYGRVSRHGAMALCWTMDKLGPLCRSADDCGLVLEAIAGHDPADPSSVARPWRYAPEREPQQGFRLCVLKGGAGYAQPDVAANFEAALAVLRPLATIDEVELEELPYGPVATTIIRAEASSAFEDLIESGRVAELTAPEDRVNPLAYDAVSARDYLRALRLRGRIARSFDALLARFDALLAPTTATVASPIDQRFSDYLRREGAPPLVPAANVAGLPAVAVPTGFGERGLPTSMQILGRAFDENRILAVAGAYQRRTDWHLRLPPIALPGAASEA
ncbi:MAG TPA: amidase [Dehalococcoidia bacterium]|nr:amidase [Dehalococcoidia bacterium]